MNLPHFWTSAILLKKLKMTIRNLVLTNLGYFYKQKTKKKGVYMRNEKGFSLIELMIVVVIIGILSTIAVPQYQRFQTKARQSEAKSNLSSLYTTEKAFQAEWNQYYGDFNALGFTVAGVLGYNIGFANGAAVGPATHPVLAYRAAAVTFNANVLCGAPGVANTASAECDLGVGASPGALPATNVINNAAVPIATFAAGARGNIDADAIFDQWQINQLKQLTQPVPAEVDTNQ